MNWTDDKALCLHKQENRVVLQVGVKVTNLGVNQEIVVNQILTEPGGVILLTETKPKFFSVRRFTTMLSLTHVLGITPLGW